MCVYVQPQHFEHHFVKGAIKRCSIRNFFLEDNGHSHSSPRSYILVYVSQVCINTLTLLSSLGLNMVRCFENVYYSKGGSTASKLFVAQIGVGLAQLGYALGIEYANICQGSCAICIACSTQLDNPL